MTRINKNPLNVRNFESVEFKIEQKVAVAIRGQSSFYIWCVYI